MPSTEFRAAKVPIRLEIEAREALSAAGFAGLSYSILLRAGLASLAGHAIPDAIALAQLKPGPPRRRLAGEEHLTT